MAMAVRSGEETRQLQVVCLEELVSADDWLRRVEELVSWTAVRATAARFTRISVARVSIRWCS